MKSFYRILTDEELIALLNRDRSAEREFYRRYKIKVVWILNRFNYRIREREDLIQEGMIGLFQALQTFDPGKGYQFSTYANACIKNRIHNVLLAIWRQKKNVDESKDIEEIVVHKNPEIDTIQDEMLSVFHYVQKELEPLEKLILDKYLENISYKMIALDLGISTKKVDNVLMKIKTKLAGQILE